MYGASRLRGHRESYIGSWLARSGRRDEVVLATKVYQPMGDGPNDRGLSARHIVAACEASLTRLGTDRIDLYQMHHVDRGTPWEEIWQAMDRLVTQGKVVYVGSSNFAGWHLAGAQAAAIRRHSLGLVSEQLKYSLLTRHVELEVVPVGAGAGHRAAAVVAAGPGAAVGGAAQAPRRGAAGRTTSHARGAGRRAPGGAGGLRGVLRRAGPGPGGGGAGLGPVPPEVTAPIVGPRTPAQLDQAVAALDVTLTDEAVARLDEIFPPVGSGGPGPEAWAW